MRNTEHPLSALHHAHAANIGCAALPGTCGELFLGLLDDQPCLVSCPIDSFATARVTIAPGHQIWRSDQPISKTLAVLSLAASQLALPESGEVVIHSTLPRGQGYGSSTADIGAALTALAHAVGQSLDPAVAARLAVQIEPSDGTLFPGLALFAHRAGERLADLGSAPLLTVIVLDPGGEVDTLTYNREVKPNSLRRFRPQYREAFDMLQTGLIESDWEWVGQAATLSARIHQAILFNPLLDLALDLCRKLNGLGLCRAHSGTILGLLFDSHRIEPDTLLQRARALTPDGVTVSHQVLVGGGPR
jgi:L-threonine kinase